MSEKILVGEEDDQFIHWLGESLIPLYTYPIVMRLVE